MVDEAQAELRWKEALVVYTRPRVIAMMFLGFSAGLPLYVLFNTISTWLREEDISRSAIGFFFWVTLTYSVKFLWAPVVDRVPLPFITGWMGKRRSWMLLAQAGIALGFVAMSSVNPRHELMLLAGLALLVAFSSATQDITIDAYRIEAMPKRFQGAMSATYIFGYRTSQLFAVAGALYIAEFLSWTVSYLAMAVLMLVGIFTTLIIREPEHTINQGTVMMEERVIAFLQRSAHLPEYYRRVSAWFIGAVVCPFVDFFERNGKYALIILLFIGIYRISDIAMGVMANPFYIDMGFSKAEIASVAKLFGFFMTITGAAIGGLLVVRYGIMRPLLLGAVLVVVTNLLFAYMAGSEASITLLALVISADNLSGGIATSTFIAYLSSLTNTAYTATQYALFSSLMTLLPKFLGGLSGMIVDAQGYIFFFLYASAIGIPAILLVMYLMRAMNVDTSAPVYK